MWMKLASRYTQKHQMLLLRQELKRCDNRSTGRKGQITVVASAAGQVLPPIVLFDVKKLSHAWTSGEIPSTSYGCCNKGWINTDLFGSWVRDHFVKHPVAARPLMLLLDGHSTHQQPEVVHLARSKQILMLCLPPHTTHEA